MRELKGKAKRRRLRDRARMSTEARTGVLGMAGEWIDLQAAKFKTERMAYQGSRDAIDDMSSQDPIPESESARHEADLPGLMARSDFQFRNNGLYSGIITRAVDNIVGAGSEIVMLSDDKEYNRAVEHDWQEFYRDSSFTTNILSGPQSQHVAMLDCMRGGNSLWYRSDAGWQMFEPAQLGTPWGYSLDQRKIAGGIEKGADGKPSRYWVGPFSAWGYVDKLNARGIRADRCHLMGHREYASGFRSVPPLASSVNRFIDLDKYLEAELFGARMAASVVGVVKSVDPNIKNIFGNALSNAAQKNGEAPPIQDRVKLAPAQIISLINDEEFDLKSAVRPGNMFGEYVRLMCRVVGIKIGMPLEIGLLDFSETNFSSSKMLMLQARVTWQKWQGLVLEPLVRRQFADWYAVYPKRKSVKNDNRFRVDHHIPPWVDYLKEAMGRTEMMEAGVLSATGVAREMGHELEDSIRERIAEYQAVGQAATAAGFTEGSEEWKQAVAYGLGNIGKFRQDLVKAGFLENAA